MNKRLYKKNLAISLACPLGKVPNVVRRKGVVTQMTLTFFALHNPQSSPTAMPAPLTLRLSLSQAMRREKLLVVLMSLCDAGSI